MGGITKNHKDIIDEVAKELGISPTYVVKVVNFYYRSLSKLFSTIKLDDPSTFKDINVPSLFTLVPTYKKTMRQVYLNNFRSRKATRVVIDIEDFKRRANEDMKEIRVELREKRKKSQLRDNKYNNHRNKINEKRNNENIHNGASDTSNSTRDANDKGI